ncbi:FAD-dependent monooxygenase [Nocardia tengchongensis]
MIAGAGLGGLCLAQGLRGNGMEFEVYERDAEADSRTQGYRIRIDETGQQSLAECLPGELVEMLRDTSAVAGSGGRFVDVELNEVSGRVVDTWRPSAVEGADTAEDGDLSVNRQTLREILMTGITDKIRFGKELIHVSESAGGVTARFRDGTSTVCDVLVAADGVNSAVRRQLVPAADPVDTGMVCLYGRTTLTPRTRALVAETLLDGTSVVFAEGFAVIVDAMAFRASAFDGRRLTPVNDYLYWACFGTRTALGFADSGELDGDMLETAVGISADWHPGLRAVFTASDRNALAVLPIRSAQTLTDWPGGRVTALGDAVHAMSPAGGLGANTALRDAATLSMCLGSGRGTLLSAVADYEQRMHRYAREAVTASQRGAERLTAAAASRNVG